MRQREIGGPRSWSHEEKKSERGGGIIVSLDNCKLIGRYRRENKVIRRRGGGEGGGRTVEPNDGARRKSAKKSFDRQHFSFTALSLERTICHRCTSHHSVI